MFARSPRVDWSYLRWLIERSLSGRAGFPAQVRIETRIARCGDGLFHENYVFATGQQQLVLRMAKRARAQRTAAESVESLLREAKTLQQLQRCGFSYPAPRLVCVVTDDAGATVGLVETCMDGSPLSYFDSPAHSEFRLKTIAKVAAQVHQLPKSEFTHLPAQSSQGSAIVLSCKSKVRIFQEVVDEKDQLSHEHGEGEFFGFAASQEAQVERL